MKRLKLVPIALVAALSACHQNGVGVDSGASQKAATGAENSLRSDRGIQEHMAAAASIRMPAAGLIVNALNAWGAQAMPRTFSGIANLQPGGYGKGGLDELRTIMQTMNRDTPTPLHVLRALHLAAAAMIVQTAQPCVGWPTGGFTRQGQARMGAWGRKVAREIAFSNLVLTQIAATPALRNALADPQAAQRVIVDAFLAITPDQLNAAWEQAGREGRGDLVLDMTGGGPPVHFMIGNSDYQGGPTGWQWAQNGVAWFGDSAISGKRVDLSLESALDKSQSQTSGTSTGISSSTEQSANGTAGVK